MAYSTEQWERTKALFESGQYSLSEISATTGIDKSQISRKSKIQQWESGRNADYIEAKVKIATKKTTENTTALQILDDIAEDKIRRSGLVFGGLESLAKLVKTSIEKNQTIDKLNCGDGIQNFEPRELNTTDYKNLSTTLADIGKAFGLIEAQSAIKIDNSNNQQTNISTLEISKAIADGLPD